MIHSVQSQSKKILQKIMMLNGEIHNKMTCSNNPQAKNLDFIKFKIKY